MTGRLHHDFFMEEGYPPVRVMYIGRLKRENRYEEFMGHYRRIHDPDNGIRHNQAWREAANLVGYPGAQAERDFYDEWRRDRIAARDSLAEVDYGLDEHIFRREQAIIGLPPAAAVEDELSWVASHPKMRDHEGLVKLEDILHSPAGKAPSQRACNMLLHYQDEKRSEKFWAAWLGQVVKRKEESAKPEGEKEALRKDMSAVQLASELEKLSG